MTERSWSYCGSGHLQVITVAESLIMAISCPENGTHKRNSCVGLGKLFPRDVVSVIYNLYLSGQGNRLILISSVVIRAVLSHEQIGSQTPLGHLYSWKLSLLLESGIIFKLEYLLIYIKSYIDYS